MASTTDNVIDSNDESHLKVLKDQILSNLRILQPDIKDPIITSAFEKNKNKESEDAGLWTASVWNDDKEVLYCTYGIHVDLVTAMRTLLRLTSVAVDAKLDKWQKTWRSAVYTDDGLKYD
ncbi:hypothetical protein M436DRAFT_66843 [Aureobasidium namibiae CBS 147.97]|uniref:Uncharacterized protein n=1 Tax=Aureobasidium namibiae CBS 147.97 TaxID=1043004 RepID=A0A074X5Z2_9PEZI